MIDRIEINGLKSSEFCNFFENDELHCVKL